MESFAMVVFHDGLDIPKERSVVTRSDQCFKVGMLFIKPSQALRIWYVESLWSRDSRINKGKLSMGAGFLGMLQVFWAEKASALPVYYGSAMIGATYKKGE